MMSAKKGNMAKKTDPFTCSRLQGKNLDGRPESTQSPSRRHREKLNSELEELGKLLPLPDDVRSKLDKLSILRLGVSFFQIENFVSGEKQNTSPRVNDNASFSVLKKFKREGLCLSEAALEALGGFFCIFTSEGEVFFVSENVKIHTGYTQSFLMHQNFLQFIDPDDSMGFRECIAKPKEARIVELDSNGNPRVEGCHHRVCFCNVRCHAGRQSSHVSPFFYKSFRFDGYLRLVNVKSKKLKEYCYFAICVPSHVTSSVGRPPKDLVPYYQIKVGLDYTIKKLDNNGQKYLQYSDKQVANIDAYLLFHPEDIQGMAQMHKHLIESGKCIAVFRALTGKGIWRWVRGSARIVCDKKGKPEFVIASNWMVGDDEGVYYKKQLLESFENEQQAITDGKEGPQTDKDTKSESSKEEATKDSKSKPVSTRKSSTRKSNKRKGHGTESDERISSNGISPAQPAVTENRSSQRVLDRKTSSASESSQHSHTSSQSSATSVPSSSPEQSTASESLVSVSSSGPGSSEDVTSPGSFGNESSGEPGNLGLSNGSLPLHHQNGNSSVSPSSSDLSLEGSASAYHIPQEQYINGQQHLADAPMHSIVQERSNLPNAGCVSAPFVPAVNELRPFSTISPPPQLIQSEEMQSMAGPQETRPLQSMIPPMLQAVSSYGENIPSMPLQQTALNLSSMSMPMTTENLQPTTVMPQDVYGMTIPNVRPSVPVPQAAHVSVSSTTQQVYQVPNTIPTHESQNIRPDLQSSSMQQPSQSKKLSHLPRSVDPSVALQQEVNLSDGQLEALKKFLVNWGSKGGIQPSTRNTPAHEIPLEPQLDSITPEKLQLLHSLVNGQGSSAVNPEQRPSVTEGLVSNGLMGQEISQQSGIPQREPVIRSQLFGAEHPARGASYDSFNNPLHDVVQNTQRLRIGTNPDIIPPYTNVPQRVEDHYIHHNSSYPLFNQQPSTLGGYDMRQQPTPHYSSTPATQNYVSCHNFGNQSLNVSNCAPHPSSLVQPGLSPQNISSFSDGMPSFGNAQQQIDLFQSAPKPASNNFTSVGITSNSGGYNYENISTSYDTSSGSGNLLDVIDLHSTKDLFVPPPNVQSSEPLQQQQQQQHLQQHTTQDATDASLGIFEDATVGVHLMPSAGQMEPQLMGSSHYDGLDIPNIPVLEQILESRDVDNLFNHEQSNQKELYQQGNHIAPGNTGGNTFWKPLPQGKQSQTQLLESLLTNGN